MAIAKVDALSSKKLYLVRCYDGRCFIAQGRVTQEAEQAVQDVIGKNTVQSVTPLTGDIVEMT